MDLKNSQLRFMQVRLFRKAMGKWRVGNEECASIFEKDNLMNYISDCWEEFHQQGDEACMDDIEEYLKAQGCVK